MTNPPVDQAARDRIRNDLDSTLFVEAGAGTGKTTSLVGRIERLISTGRTTADKVAAITFTEAAAAELRDRVRAELEGAADDDRRPAEERERCLKALDSLDAAAVETIHAFAGRILSGHPLEAGLPPGFQVMDEVRAATLFDERWDVHVQLMLSEPSLAEPLGCAFALEATVSDLRGIARQFHYDWDRVGEIRPEDFPVAPGVDELKELASQIKELCDERNTCTDLADKLYVHLSGLDEFAVELSDPPDTPIGQIRLLLDRPTIKAGNSGKKGAWTERPIDEIRSDLLGIHDACGAYVGRIGAGAMAPIVASLRDFVLDQADARRRMGQLEFHDLLVRARDLLADNADVRASVRKRFTHVLVDEFQDTDPIQTDIARLLASTLGSPLESWSSAGVEPGRLFFVGDPKQSIYRFRRADIVQYQSIQEQVASEPLRLTQSFRAVPAIADWVNAVLAPLMGTESRKGQATYVSMHADRPEHPEGVTVRLLGTEFDERVSAVRSREAAEIVSQIRSAKAERWRVSKGKDADGDVSYRDARYQDIAILVPTRTSVPQLETELEKQGVPYRLESQGLVYQTQEVRDLLSVLRAVDDPTDEIALVASLRSPGFGVADDELARWAEAGGRWDYRAECPNGARVPDSIRNAMSWLLSLHERRWWQTVSETVEQVIRERRLMELATFDRRPRQRWQRLRFVQDQARAFLDGGGRTLRQFLMWTDRQEEEKARVRDSVVPETDDDAVRIMTIHASKGLEFPIVVLMGLNSAPKRNQVSPVLWGEGGTAEIRLSKGVQTSGYEDAKTHEDELERFERIRLLYVAATRARDHLVVSVHRTARGGSETLAGMIADEAEDCPHLWKISTASEEVPSEAVEDVPAPTDTAADRESWISERTAAIERLTKVSTVSATGIAKFVAKDDSEAGPDEEPSQQEGESWRRGRAGTSIGRAVHSTLQVVDLETGEGLAENAKAQAVVEGVASRSDEVHRLARMALGTDTVRRAVESGRFWRELYVGAPVGGTLIEGFIDLLYEGPEGYVVVDYKTDALPDDADALASALMRYRPQGAAYVLALEEALQVTVARCVFLFLTPARAVEAEISDLRAAVSDVRDVVAGMAADGVQT